MSSSYSFDAEPTPRPTQYIPWRKGEHAGPPPTIPDLTRDDCRRGSPRRRVLRNALIVFRGGHCTLRCVVCDLSETGALLRPSDPAMCPGAFVLKQQDGPARHCEVAWRRDGMVGVRFL
jgi:hypothetical protein